MTTNITVNMKRQFLLVVGAFSLVVLFFCWFFFKTNIVYSIAVGFLFGICENGIMILDIEKGSKTTWQKAFAIMKKSMLKRLAFLIVSTFMAIKSGIYMPALFIAFFSIHFVCLGFFVINAWGNDKSSKCRKE